MKTITSGLLAGLLLGAASVYPAVTIQSPGNVIGTGDQAWSYLILEGESYNSEMDENPEMGFGKVDSSGSRTSHLGEPILGPLTTASGKGALWTQTPISIHGDKVTYQVQFSKAGTYYLYMRFTMYENGGNEGSYGNEDSFFVPPDWGKDPQTDWPLSDRGGYVEGCCGDAGWLWIKQPNGEKVSYISGDEKGRAYWEGNFHWNQAILSQWLTPEQGTPNVKVRLEVTEAQLNQPLDFTISYREGGTAIDLFLFSTNPNLMDEYTQEELDQLLLQTGISYQDPGDVVGTGQDAWSYFVLEGESYDWKQLEDLTAGFARVDSTTPRTSHLGKPILAADTTASSKAALFTQTVFSQHGDKITYLVQFAHPGTYYLYMRFTMFENGQNEGSYGNDDSFFVPPDFNKDPQTDWPLSERGGYVEGCCGDAGFLWIKQPGGEKISYFNGDEAGRAYWEGNFHWNELLISQWITTEQGEPRARVKFEVTPEQVGLPMEFTISYREGGVTIDLFLFATKDNLMETYTQEQLDQIILGGGLPTGPSLTISRSGSNVIISWPVSATGYGLETTGSLSGTWSAVAGTPVVNGDQNTVTVDASTGTAYYRLKK